MQSETVKSAPYPLYKFHKLLLTFPRYYLINGLIPLSKVSFKVTQFFIYGCSECA